MTLVLWHIAEYYFDVLGYPVHDVAATLLTLWAGGFDIAYLWRKR